jgi:hypothetical protein
MREHRRHPVRTFIHAIPSANAEFYSANLAAEAREGLTRKAKSGGTPFHAPIGYLNVRQLIDGGEIRTGGSPPTGHPPCVRGRRLRHRPNSTRPIRAPSLQAAVQTRPKKSGWPDSNRRPHRPKRCATTRLSYTPQRGLV